MLRKIGIQKSGKANAVRRKRVSILNVNVRREENRRVQARRFALRFGGAALAVLLVGLAIMGTRVLGRILFTQNPRYAIRVLDIRTDGRLPPELVRRYVKIHEGMNLFTVQLRSVRDEILGFPVVRSVSVERKLPDTLTIRIIERIPLARLSVDGMAVYLAVDRDGVVLGPTSAAPHLPVIDASRSGTLRPGGIVDRSEVIDAIRLLDVCDTTRLGQLVRIQKIHLQDEDRMILDLATGDRVIFPREQMDVKLRRLASLLKAMQERRMRDPGRPVQIDMMPEANFPVSGLG